MDVDNKNDYPAKFLFQVFFLFYKIYLIILYTLYFIIVFMFFFIYLSMFIIVILTYYVLYSSLLLTNFSPGYGSHFSTSL